MCYTDIILICPLRWEEKLKGKNEKKKSVYSTQVICERTISEFKNYIHH